MRCKKAFVGDVRIIEEFLWFPKTLRNPITFDEETRWLEVSSYKQQLVTSRNLMNYIIDPSRPWVWEDVGFWEV